MSGVLRGSKKKKASDLKIGNIILGEAGKKCKIVGIRKVKGTADMAGLKGAPINSDFFIVDYTWTDPRYSSKGTPPIQYTKTWRGNDMVVYFPGPKKLKFSAGSLLIASLVGMLTGMSIILLGLYFT